MIFDGVGRDRLRQAWAEAWRKARAGEVLQAQEAAIAGVVEDHPEYQDLLGDPRALERDFSVGAGESNPFLHLSMHLAIREQVATDRPPGIAAVHRALAAGAGVHAAEHRMMECLGETLWEAQRAGLAPDEQRYLQRLGKLRG